MTYLSMRAHEKYSQIILVSIFTAPFEILLENEKLIEHL